MSIHARSVRTSVGAHPHVVEGAGAAAAADDVDGAGGVDHGRVRMSGRPRRIGDHASPRDTCGHVGNCHVVVYEGPPWA